jgi:hypothetical protein
MAPYSLSFLCHVCTKTLFLDVETNSESVRFSGLAHIKVDIHYTQHRTDPKQTLTYF